MPPMFMHFSKSTEAYDAIYVLSSSCAYRARLLKPGSGFVLTLAIPLGLLYTQSLRSFMSSVSLTVFLLGRSSFCILLSLSLYTSRLCLLLDEPPGVHAILCFHQLVIVLRFPCSIIWLIISCINSCIVHFVFSHHFLMDIVFLLLSGYILTAYLGFVLSFSCSKSAGNKSLPLMFVSFLRCPAISIFSSFVYFELTAAHLLTSSKNPPILFFRSFNGIMNTSFSSAHVFTF
mmetsp:Transcript_12293/g.29430  ORF Transcript_12293/g.29430 Transcript_12293/m.29430 type:complete len:232 (-) Transcript_12293:87-782(-)